MAWRVSFPSANSSFVRSYINTLASTAVPSDSTIPAIPDSVRAAWNDVRIPNVKNKLTNKAMFAIIPGVKPYITTM